MASDLTQIFMLHKRIQQLDIAIQHERSPAQSAMADEWDVAMQQLVQLMGEASKRKMC